MKRLALAALVATLAFAGTAVAMPPPGAVNNVRPPSAVPEPGAALLFAAGLGVSAWMLRRRADRD